MRNDYHATWNLKIFVTCCIVTNCPPSCHNPVNHLGAVLASTHFVIPFNFIYHSNTYSHPPLHEAFVQLLPTQEIVHRFAFFTLPQLLRLRACVFLIEFECEYVHINSPLQSATRGVTTLINRSEKTLCPCSMSQKGVAWCASAARAE